MNLQIEKIFESFESSGHQIFLVGGFVRDLLRAQMSRDVDGKHDAVDDFWLEVNNGSIDVDFATSAHPKETIRVLESVGLKAIPIGIEFGTVQTLMGDNKVEITTFRCHESYTKGSRKPGVVFGDSIEQDLARRDFTFNAIAMGRELVPVSHFGGISDLVKGVIATPIDPEVSFSDDPLRMLRACRFVARGFGGLENSTAIAMEKLAHLVKEVSSERIFEEMTKLLLSDKPSAGLNAMSDFGLLWEIFPELEALRNFREDQGRFHHLPVWEHTMMVLDNSHPSPTVRWAALFHDVAKPQTWSRKGDDVQFYKHDMLGSKMWEIAADRLKTSKKLKEHVSQLIFEHQNVRPEMGEKGVRRLVHRMGDRLEDLFLLREADIIGHKPGIMKSSLDAMNGLKRRCMSVQVTISSAELPKGCGNLLMSELGLKGPELGEVMSQLKQKLIDGDIATDSDFVEEAKKCLCGN